MSSLAVPVAGERVPSSPFWYQATATVSMCGSLSSADVHVSVPSPERAAPARGASTASATSLVRVTYSAARSTSFCGMVRESTGLVRSVPSGMWSSKG